MSRFRTTARALLRRPGFSTVVILTLALGIGANTAVFTVLKGVLLTPLPYSQPETLVRILKVNPDRPGEMNTFLTGLDVLDYRGQADVLEQVSAFYTYRELGSDVRVGDRPQRIKRLRTDAAYFQIFGVGPILGRGFTREEETAEARLAVLSESLWERMFDADPGAIGQSIELDGEAYEVIGVMPRGFRNPLGGEIDVWVPQNLQAGGNNNRGNHYLTGVARLAPGLTLEAAQARLNVAIAAVMETDPDLEWYPQLVPLHQDTVGRASTTLWVLLGAVGLLLLAACVNVASLFLARSVSRSRELSVRAALGAGRGALLRTLLSESLLLSAAGGALGLLFAVGGVRALVALAPEALPRLGEVGIDPLVLLFTALVSVGTGLAFGLIPGLRFSRPDVARALRDGERGSTGGRWTHSLQGALVAAEVALAVVLLMGAGVLFRSFTHLQEVDLVVEPQGVLTYEVHLPMARYSEPDQRQAFYDEFLPRIEALPGVTAAGGISWLPVQGRYHSWGIRRSDVPNEDENWHDVDVRVVEGGILEALGIPLLEGRDLLPTDRSDTPMMALVSENLAQDLFPEGDAVGGEVQVGGRSWQIAGVVAAAPHDAEGSVARTVYLPHTQFGDNRNWAIIQAVRTRGPLPDLVDRLREELRAVDGDLVLYRMRPLESLLAGKLAQQRFALTLMWVFAGLAGLLCAVGIYGVLSYMVSQRVHEMGIRMALGAQQTDVRRMVVGRGLRLSLAGLALGLGVGWWGMAALRSMVFEVPVRDPWVMALVAGGLLGVSWLSALIPALRASRVEPARAFQGE